MSRVDPVVVAPVVVTQSDIPRSAALPHLVAATVTTVALVAMLALGGCSRALHNMPGVYRIDVQQGNVVTQDMLYQLKPGMEKRQVRYVLGTPLLTDTFHQDRWDYVYSYQKGRKTRVQRRISLFFEDDRLARVEGDVEPGSANPPAPKRKDVVVDVPPREDEGFLASLLPGLFKQERSEQQKREDLTQSEPIFVESEATETSAEPPPDSSPPPPTQAATAGQTQSTEIQPTAPPPTPDVESVEASASPDAPANRQVGYSGPVGTAIPPSEEYSPNSPASIAVQSVALPAPAAEPQSPSETAQQAEQVTEDSGFLKKLFAGYGEEQDDEPVVHDELPGEED